MRSLSARQAAACEQAETARCRCRCGGEFHGAGRVKAGELGYLPEGDPHHVSTMPDQLDAELQREQLALFLDTFGRLEA